MRNPRPPRQAREARELRLSEIIPCFPRAIRQPDGSFMVNCPTHPDDTPSLHLTERNGQLLAHCFGGCEQSRVWQALLELAGHSRPSQGNARPSREQARTSREPESRDSEEPAGLSLAQYCEAKRLDPALLQQWGVHDTELRGRPAIAVPYLNERGETVAMRYRLSLAGENRFRWARGNRPLLYGAWRVHEFPDDVCYLVEGESDCHSLWSANLPALACPGAGTWRESWWFHLMGFQRVIVVPDSDEAGQSLARRLAETAPPIALERTEVVQLPCKDVSELWQLCEANPERFRAELEQLPRKPLREWREGEPEGEPEPIQLRPASAVESVALPPVIHPLLYEQGVSLLVGLPASGKTVMSLELASAIADGTRVWGNLQPPEGAVLWCDYDHPAEQLLPLLEGFLHTRRLDRLYFASNADGEVLPITWETYPRWVRTLKTIQPKLLVLDTLLHALDVRDELTDLEARSGMQLLRQLAREVGCAVLGVHHPRKLGAESPAIHSASGNLRWTAAADVVAYLSLVRREGVPYGQLARLSILKNRHGQCPMELEFLRTAYRFVPASPEQVPPTEWDVVRKLLEQRGEATYRELTEALQQAGFRVSENAVQLRARRRWQPAGLVEIVREGFPAVARIRLNRVQVLIPKPEDRKDWTDCSDRTDWTDRTDCPTVQSSSVSSVLTLSIDANSESVPSPSRAEGSGAEPSLAPAEPAPATAESDDSVLTGEGLVATILREFQGSRLLSEREMLEARLRLLQQDPVAPLGADEVAEVLALWRLAESKRFPRLDVPNYAVVERGASGWRAFLECAAGSGAVQLALELLQQPPNHATQPSLFES